MKMTFLLRLHDDLPRVGLWNDDTGHLHAYWRDACKVSSWNSHYS
jgi:hypothetical protein